ncbi:MAG: hypothetical protein P9L94_04325 [Candidatus Hinthialibacter antarcticus]|nr:hypothetical protein [Candidatus Hinthialibacter antarcticus]
MFDAKIDVARNHAMNYSTAMGTNKDVGQAGKYEGKDGGAGPYISLRKQKKQKEEKKEQPVAQGHINIVA